jgi:hypothetical protein
MGAGTKFIGGRLLSTIHPEKSLSHLEQEFESLRVRQTATLENKTATAARCFVSDGRVRGPPRTLNLVRQAGKAD